MKNNSYVLFTKSIQKTACLSLAAVLLAQGAGVYAANMPDAGGLLRDSRQQKESIPERKTAEIHVAGQDEKAAVSDSGPKVAVRQIKLTGQTIISETEADTLLAGFQGKELTFNQLEQAAVKVTLYLRENGYIAAQAYLPAQEMPEGFVEIAVMPGRFGDVILKNTSGIADAVVLSQLDFVKKNSYIQKDILEQGVLLLNDLAGAQAKFTLSPGKEVGTADLIVEIKRDDKPVSYSIGFNNGGNRFSGANQFTLSGSFKNPAHNGDLLSVSGTTAGGGMNTGSISYQVPFMAAGGSLSFGVSRVRYALGQDFAYLDANGTADTIHTGWSYYLNRSRSYNLQFTAGWDYKKLQDKIDSVASVSDKQVKVFSAGFTGDSMDTWLGGGRNSFSVMQYSGKLHIDSPAFAQQDQQTAQSAGNYTKWTYSFVRQQNLAERLSGTFSFNGQFASKNLDSSEKMSLGGMNGVRAYPAGEASADQAWLANIEFKWTLPAEPAEKNNWQVVGFYDAGKATINKTPWAGAGENSRMLRAAGIGLNWINPGNGMVKLSYAWKIGDETAQSDADKKGRFWIQAMQYF